MRIWLINNTRFGYKNNSTAWSDTMFDYFNSSFLPMLKKHHKDGDVVVHCGNLFNNSESINTRILNKTMELFDSITGICDLYLVVGENDRVLNNSNSTMNIFKHHDRITVVSDSVMVGPVKLVAWAIDVEMDCGVCITSSDVSKCEVEPTCKVYSGYGGDAKRVDGNIISVGSAYQLDYSGGDNGFYIIDSVSGKDMFVKNNYSPVHKVLVVNTMSDLESIDRDYVDKNNICVKINNSLVEESKIKTDILLSKYKFKKIEYFCDGVTEVREKVDYDFSSIEDMIRSKLSATCSDETLLEFDNIISIYKEKY